MARGTLVSTLLSMLKAECGMSLDATASAKDAALIQLLSNKQLFLSAEYSWPYLKHKWNVDCAVNARYLDIPTQDDRGENVTINFERPVITEVRFGNIWIPVEYGINAEQYSAIDPELGKTNSPIRNWQFSTNPNESSNANQFEIWPMAATVQTFRFTGQRVLNALAATTDRADLDDLLIVLYTAADLVGPKQTATKVAAAQARLRQVRGGMPSERGRFNLACGGRPNAKMEKKHIVPVIAVHG